MDVPGETHVVEGLPQAGKNVSAPLFSCIFACNSPTMLQVVEVEISSYEGPMCAPQGCHEVCSEGVTVVGFHVENRAEFPGIS